MSIQSLTIKLLTSSKTWTNSFVFTYSKTDRYPTFDLERSKTQKMDPLTIGLGVTGLAGQIFGAGKSGQANREMARMLREKDAANEAFFNNSVNRTFLDTNAAKGVLERVRKQYQDANQIADNKGVVTGATPEAVIAAKTANNEALNNVTSQIAEQATAYQDAKEQQYRAMDNAITYQQMQLQANKAKNAANLASNAGNLTATAATSFLFGNNGDVLNKIWGK